MPNQCKCRIQVLHSIIAKALQNLKELSNDKDTKFCVFTNHITDLLEKPLREFCVNEITKDCAKTCKYAIRLYRKKAEELRKQAEEDLRQHLTVIICNTELLQKEKIGKIKNQHHQVMLNDIQTAAWEITNKLKKYFTLPTKKSP